MPGRVTQDNTPHDGSGGINDTEHNNGLRMSDSAETLLLGDTSALEESGL